MLIQWSEEHSAPVAWAASAGNYKFQTVDVERQLLRLTEGSAQKSRLPMYYNQMPEDGGAVPRLPYTTRHRWHEMTTCAI